MKMTLEEGSLSWIGLAMSVRSLFASHRRAASTSVRARSTARLRGPAGKWGSVKRRIASMVANTANHGRDWCKARGARRMRAERPGNSSSIVTPCGWREEGFVACRTSSGASTVRPQYEIRNR